VDGVHLRSRLEISLVGFFKVSLELCLWIQWALQARVDHCRLYHGIFWLRERHRRIVRLINIYGSPRSILKRRIIHVDVWLPGVTGLVRIRPLVGKQDERGTRDHGMNGI
jgi:hypothetical protein